MRFRLDPTAPDVERPPVAPPPPPGVPRAPPPTAAPPAPASPPALPARNRRLLAIGALVVVALVGLGAAAFAITGALAYPDKYLLEEDEIPAGLAEGRLTAEEREEYGVTSNPGEISSDELDQFSDREGDPPEKGWVQVLGDSGGGTQRLVVLALQYENEDSAKSAATQLRALCSFAGGAVLRDGDVVVALAPEGSGMRASVPVVAKLIEEKSGAAAICGVPS